MEYNTSELCDIYLDTIDVVEPLFASYGGRRSFGGQITTVKCFEDNGLIVEQLRTEGAGRVLLVDGGGSLRRALIDADIATLAPFTVQPEQTAFDALLLMARHNIHHIPVIDGPEVLGVITAGDLAERHSTSAVFLTSEICQHTTLQGLQRSSAQIRHLQQNLAAAQATLPAEVTDALDALFAPGQVAGARYTEAGWVGIEGS